MKNYVLYIDKRGKAFVYRLKLKLSTPRFKKIGDYKIPGTDDYVTLVKSKI